MFVVLLTVFSSVNLGLMSYLTKLLCGITLITVLGIQYGGFFVGSVGDQLPEPNSLIGILYAGAFLLMISLLILGIGLIRNKAAVEA